jgi:ABC-type glycerol-3-phosphate transport system substrate-binding protein
MGSWLPVPASRKGKKVQLSGGHTWTIFKGSKSPEAMFKISEYMNTPEPCQVMWDMQGWLPAVKAFLDKADAAKYPALDFYFKSYKEANEWHTPPRCEITSFVSTEYMSLREKVNRDEMTAEQAAEELQKRAENEYKNQGFIK